MTDQPLAVACLHILEPLQEVKDNQLVYLTLEISLKSSTKVPKKPLPPATTMRFDAIYFLVQLLRLEELRSNGASKTIEFL
jgi:hypothetical protein